MEKSNLYTRTGDAGTTALVGGSRIPKDDIRIEAYGTTDELSSALGMIAATPGCAPEIREKIYIIQNRLFNIGSYLATPVEKAPEHPHGLNISNIENLEKWIDTLDSETPPLRAFILPGGCPAAAAAHMARTICRRAERCVLRLSRRDTVAPIVVQYLNRLSDLLFAMARYFNHLAEEKEIEWNSGL